MNELTIHQKRTQVTEIESVVIRVSQSCRWRVVLTTHPSRGCETGRVISSRARPITALFIYLLVRVLSSIVIGHNPPARRDKFGKVHRAEQECSSAAAAVVQRRASSSSAAINNNTAAGRSTTDSAERRSREERRRRRKRKDYPRIKPRGPSANPLTTTIILPWKRTRAAAFAAQQQQQQQQQQHQHHHQQQPHPCKDQHPKHSGSSVQGKAIRLDVSGGINNRTESVCSRGASRSRRWRARRRLLLQRRQQQHQAASTIGNTAPRTTPPTPPAGLHLRAAGIVMSALGARLNGGVVETRRRTAAKAAAAQQGAEPAYRRRGASCSGGESSADEDPPQHLAVLGKVNEEEISKGGVVTYNMVAAMNEHLSSSPVTNSLHSPTGIGKEKFKDQNKAKDKSGSTANAAEDNKVVNLLGFPCDFDHMYASMTDDGAPATATSVLGVSPLRGNDSRPNDLTEVKHLKELLLLHLDLIQQQSEQIVTKDKLLAALRQENETLKLRLERMDRRVSLQKFRSDSTENTIDHLGSCSPPSLETTVNSLPSTSENHITVQPDSYNSQYGESFKIRLNTSGGITTVKQENSDSLDVKQEAMGDSWDSRRKRKNSSIDKSSNKRSRGVSSSSTLSNDTSSTLPDTLGAKGPSHHHESTKKSEKKGKSLMRKESFLTTEEHYYTAVGEPKFSLSLKNPTTENTPTNLEVPSWRIKVYTSCYTMEGTENLDDEIYNKRHTKLETDEKRRKRWDVQRIREQRHIEKLKQRQERQNHHSACYTNHSGPCPASPEEERITTLWPEPDQVQNIQVDPQLPISAFGASVTSFSACEFSIPWSVNAKSKTRRRPKRSNSRKRKSRS